MHPRKYILIGVIKLTKTHVKLIFFNLATSPLLPTRQSVLS